MATREEVQRLLDEGLSYEAAASRLGIPAGQAYMIATGRPADGSESPASQDATPDPGGSTQHLANPPHQNPTTSQQVRDWMAGRTAADAPMREAARDAGEEQDG